MIAEKYIYKQIKNNDLNHQSYTNKFYNKQINEIVNKRKIT